MTRDDVEVVRRFSRTVTQRVGALADEFLSRDRPLGEARVLWEIGEDGCEVRALRTRLDLDSGQLSRILRALESAGLTRVGPGPSDRRIRVAKLTPSGLAERSVLDGRSNDLAASVLAALDDDQRAELVDAMNRVVRLITAGSVDIRAVDASHPDARQCFRSYFAELDTRAERGFDPAGGSSVAPHELMPPAGCLLLAYLRSEPVGCGAVRFHPDAPAEIKRMWVSPATRGLGIGRRLLAALETRAAGSGARLVRLETNDVLQEAIALYRSAGYREVQAFNDEPFADHWFEKDLSEASDRTAR